MKFKNENGSSLVEMLMALGFISLTIGALLTLAVRATRLSVVNTVYSSVGHRANFITEEILKDYLLDGSVKDSSNYCNLTEVREILDKFEPTSPNDCVVVETTEKVSVKLTVNLYDDLRVVERTLYLQ